MIRAEDLRSFNSGFAKFRNSNRCKNRKKIAKLREEPCRYGRALVFYFTLRDNGSFVGISFFPKDKKDYTDRQVKLVLLEKSKVDLITNQTTVLYKRE